MSTIKDTCHCYCCPSASNPYGVQKECSNSNPEHVGSFEIVFPSACSSISCHVNYPVSCPDPPIRGPRNTSGIIRWGCKIGCRFSPDGLTVMNTSTNDPGVEIADLTTKPQPHLVLVFLLLLCFVG